MKRTSFKSMSCPIAAALDAIGEWWSLLVVREAFVGNTRFEQFQTRLGIARNILTTRLRALVDNGVLERRRYQERPPRFEYALTDKGRALFPVIVALMTWGNQWTRRDQIVALLDNDTGRALEPVLVDRQTAAPIDAKKCHLARAPKPDLPGEKAAAAPRIKAARRSAL